MTQICINQTISFNAPLRESSRVSYEDTGVESHSWIRFGDRRYAAFFLSSLCFFVQLVVKNPEQWNEKAATNLVCESRHHTCLDRSILYHIRACGLNTCMQKATVGTGKTSLRNGVYLWLFFRLAFFFYLEDGPESTTTEPNENFNTLATPSLLSVSQEERSCLIHHEDAGFKLYTK